jgi:hypothetical protein
MVRKTRMRSKKIKGGRNGARDEYVPELHDRILFWTPAGIRYGKIIRVGASQIVVEYISRQAAPGELGNITIIWNRIQNPHEVVKIMGREIDRYSRYLRNIGDIDNQRWWIEGIRAPAERLSESEGHMGSPKTPKRKKSKKSKTKRKKRKKRKTKRKKSHNY